MHEPIVLRLLHFYQFQEAQVHSQLDRGSSQHVGRSSAFCWPGQRILHISILRRLKIDNSLIEKPRTVYDLGRL